MGHTALLSSRIIRPDNWSIQLPKGFAGALLFLILTTSFQPFDPFSSAALASSVRPPANATVNTPPPPGVTPSKGLTRVPSPDRLRGGEVPGNTLGNRSQSSFWKSVRQGMMGSSDSTQSFPSPLIQSQGQDWRNVRNNYISRFGGWLLIGVAGVLVLFYLIRGRIPIKSGRSGKVIPRFSLTERVVHWFTAVLFILLSVSGLILLFGKYLLIPLIGKSAFGAFASASMQSHNLFGPLFIIAMVAMFFVFLKGNGFKLVDFKWALKGGGFFGGHASAHRYNFGEKAWFWWAIILGVTLSLSGLVLEFPWLAGTNLWPLLAGLAHAGAALLMIAFAIGHIYIGTVGMEGSLEGMTRGTVDENWAREHHDLWYEEHKKEATSNHQTAEAEAAGGNV